MSKRLRARLGPWRRAVLVRSFGAALLALLFGCQEHPFADSASLDVSTVEPPLGPRQGGTQLALRGRGFVAGTTVTFGDVAASAIEVVSESELRLIAPARLGPLGPVDVEVATPDGRRVVHHELFTYYALNFAAAPQPQPSNEPRALAALDLDRDGITDLVVARRNSPGLSVILRREGAPPQLLEQPLSSEPSLLAIADVSGDGLPDLLVADAAHQVIFLLLGRAGGSLTAPVPVFAGCVPNALQAADVDGDRRPDVVVGCQEADQSAYVLLNQYGSSGVAAFSTPQLLAGSPGPLALTVADFDGDGRLDVATVSTRATQRQIFLNQGGARFLAGLAQPVAPTTNALLAIDVNRDGHLDLVTSAVQRPALAVELGDGTGRFAVAPPIALSHLPGSEAAALCALDWNGDGWIDLAVSNAAAAEITLLIADGSGSFSATTLPAEGPAATLLPFAFDGSGSAALATTVRQSSQVHVFRRDAKSPPRGLGLSEQIYTTLPVAHAALAADLTNDGRVDVAWALGARFAVLASTGDGTFEAPVSFYPAASPRALTSGDWNGDQLADLAMTHAAGLSVFLSRGPGELQAPFDIPISPAPTLILSADLDGDARPDLVTASDGSALRIHVGNGNGTFRPPSVVEMGGPARALSVADLDEDGRRDLLVMTETEVRLRRGLAEGGFAPLEVLEVGQGLTALVTADMNLDGVRDLVLSSASEKEVLLLFGQPGGSFRPAQHLPVGLSGRYLVALDLDRDGNMDVALAEEGRSAVRVLLGKRDGTLQPPIEFSAELPASGLVALDLDGDHFSELLVPSPSGYSILRNLAQR